MKQSHTLKSSAVAFLIFSSVNFSQTAIAQDSSSSLDYQRTDEIDIPVADPKLALTQDDMKKEAEAKAAAERKIAQEKAAAKAAAELKKRQDAARAAGTKIEEEKTESSHTIEAGSSLSLISAKVYSRPGYWRILKLHNGIAPEKLQAGQVIKAPGLKWLLADSQFTAMYPIVSEDLMLARKIFMDVENKLEDSIKGDAIAPSEEDQKQIKVAVNLIHKCRTTLMAKREGVKNAPSAAILQLRTAARKMEEISKGSKKAAATQNLVHEHLSNSLVYSVLWARNGFK